MWTNIIRKHAIALLLWHIIMMRRTIVAQNSTLEVEVGVILDMETWVGKLGWSCINMSLSDFYNQHPSYHTRLLLNVRDSKTLDIGAATAAIDLMKNKQVIAIIGPQNSMQANFVNDLGNQSHVPIVSFSATSPSLSSTQNPFYIRATQNDSSQVRAIGAVVQAYGWKEVVLLHVDNEFGESVIPSLVDALQDVNTRVRYRSVISPSATDDQILQELYKLTTMQTRVFIVHMLPTLGSRVFAKAKEVGIMSEGYVWIMTNGITDLLSLVNDSTIATSMQGVLGVKTYVPETEKLQSFKIRWKMKFQQENPSIINPAMNIFGLLAYDATWALALAVEEIGATNFSYQKTSSYSDSTDLDKLGKSQIGQKLLQTLDSTSFKGIAGDFALIDGQMGASTFQIVNINGNAARGVGYWTPKNGLSKDVSLVNTSTYSASRTNLGVIIWPGDFAFPPPKGWDIPTSGNRLRVGVPVKEGFKEFVNVTTDPKTNKTLVSGYCKDIFDQVIISLPYAVVPEYIPFPTISGTSTRSYNDLIDQVYYGNFNAVVGDVTIIANRSLYIDFTMPYTEAGVSMVVTYKDNKSKNAWVFLKPLTWDLWLTSGCFFIFIAGVVWILEHQINEDFRGPPSYQVGTSFWFSFSTLVFAQREKIYSNLARFVVIVWVFVVLILTQSYTASLSSLLTVQQLQPSFNNVHELIMRGETVGYQDGSYVYEILRNMGFDDNKLKPYSSLQELHELLQNGSVNGGIAAAFDEVPYTKILLGNYCNKYTVIPTNVPEFRTPGFGFVFPQGSPFLPDISRAILKVIEGPQMAQIEKKWISPDHPCPDYGASVSSNRLSLENFWGLFLLAGSTAILALTVYVIGFLQKHWHVISDSTSSMWEKLVALGLHFNQKDLSSHTFQHSKSQERIFVDNVHEIGQVYPTTASTCPPSPSTFSSHTNNSISSPERGDGEHSVMDEGNLNPSAEASLQMEINIEMTNANQGHP